MTNFRYTDEEIANAITESRGVMNHASKICGMSYSALKARVRKSPELQEIMDGFAKEAKEIVIQKRWANLPKQTQFFSDEELISAIEKSKTGKISTIAQILGVANNTVYGYLRTRPAVLAKLNEVKESLNDIAEDKLYELVKNGDLQAIKYWLDSNAKNRGYGADKNINVRKVGLNFTSNVDLSKLSLHELEVINELIGKSAIESSDDSVIDAEFTQ